MPLLGLPGLSARGLRSSPALGDDSTRFWPRACCQTCRVECGADRSAPVQPDIDSTPAEACRLGWLQAFIGWLQAFIDQDRTARREVRRLEQLIEELLDEHGTTLRDEPGVGPIAAATLVCEVGDPARFDRESKFARWCGTGAVALSSGDRNSDPVKHRLDFSRNRRINSVLHIASVTQQRIEPDAVAQAARRLLVGP